MVNEETSTTNIDIPVKKTYEEKREIDEKLD